MKTNEAEEEEEGLRVQLKGRCFNATLLVKKHTSRCPWCPDPNVDIQVVGGTAGTGGQQVILEKKTLSLCVLIWPIYAMHNWASN